MPDRIEQIACADIEIPERYRQETGDMDALAEGIEPDVKRMVAMLPDVVTEVMLGMRVESGDIHWGDDAQLKHLEDR
jgi:hypothetical protein